MWTVEVDTVSVTGVKTVAMLWTTNMVNFYIEYVYNLKTSVQRVQFSIK